MRNPEPNESLAQVQVVDQADRVRLPKQLPGDALGPNPQGLVYWQHTRLHLFGGERMPALPALLQLLV